MDINLIKLNDFIKITKEFAEGIDNLPSEVCAASYQELEIQVVGKKLFADNTIAKYLCTITWNEKKHGWKALRYGSNILNDDESTANLVKLFNDDYCHELFWYIFPKDIEAVISSKSSAVPFQAKDEQLRKDVNFFFKDLAEPWVHPGQNGLKFL